MTNLSLPDRIFLNSVPSTPPLLPHLRAQGHDTTGWGIAWCLYQLGIHLDVQAKVHAELDRVFGADKDRQTQPEDLKQLRYLDCVIKECQRMYTSVPFVSRRCSKDGAKIGACFRHRFRPRF